MTSALVRDRLHLLRWMWILLAFLTLLAAAQPLLAQDDGSGGDSGGPVADEPAPAPEPAPEPAAEPAVTEPPPSDPEPAAADAPADDGTPGATAQPADPGSGTEPAQSPDAGEPPTTGGSSSDDPAASPSDDGTATTGDPGTDPGEGSAPPEDGAPAADDELAAGEQVDPGVAVYRRPEYPELNGSTAATDLEAVPPDSPNKPMTMEEARALVKASGENAQSQGYSPNYTTDGCFWRAHLYEEEAQARGYQPERIFIVAGQEDPENPAKWGYHTAMVLPVVGDDGVPRRMVFDPALSNDPIRMTDWSANEIPGERRYGADVPVKDGANPYNYVSVTPGSTSDPRNFYPASSRPAEIVPRPGQTQASANQEQVDNVRDFANEQYEKFYQRGADGSYHPDRFLWTPAGSASSGPSVVASAPSGG